MIPILYDHAEKDFTSQGLCRLADAVDCVVTEERNGIYECELKYPIDGLYFEEIFEGRLIGATHDDNGDIQPFEIYKHSAPIDGVVTFYAHHLSYRLRNHILIPFHASSCTEVMSVLKSKSLNYCPFNFITNVSTLGNFDVEYPVSIKSRLAGDGDSILNLYGPGEFKYDKWNVSFLESRGVDHGVEIRYGKNLTDITREYDESEVYTAIVPYWFKEDSDGTKTLVTLDEYGVIVSESDAVQHVFWTNENDEIIRDEQGHLIEFSSENMVYAPLDLTSEFDDAPTQAQLAVRAKQLFDAAQPWLPEDNIKISFVALWQTPEYEDYAPLEKVSLCDIVHVIHTRIGVMVDAEVIKTVYNVLLDRYNEIELGSPQTSFADEIASDTQSALEEIQRQIRRSVTADYVNEQIDNATDKITGGLGGYVKVTRNANGEPQEILIMDHPSTETAVNVIRINQAGIGFSQNGYQGPFNSAWLIDGTFDAQVINVVNLAATVIRTGYLTDAQGYNYWNLETGEFRLSSTAMLDTYKEYSYVATRDYAVGDKIEIQTGQDILIYEATTTIPKDATIQPGANVKAATAHTLLDFARKAETVTNVDVEYASHTSSITPPPEDSPLWDTVSPTWELGKYIWQRTKMTDGNGTDNYSDPVCIQGAQGTNSAIIYLYKRSASAATIDWTQTLTYSFATNRLTSLPTGWVDDLENLPDNNDPIYVTAATAGSQSATDTIPYTEWSAPVVMAQDGKDAPKTAVVVLYKRSNVTPTKPTVNLTYTFNTAKLTPSSGLAGWSQSIPAADGNPCYSIQAVAMAVGDSDVIAATEWTDVAQIFSDGLDAYNTAIVYLYKRSATAPSKPNVQTTYTFSDHSLSPVPTGWSREYIGGNNPLYVTAATASSTESSVNIGANEWSEPVILTQDGAPGADGKNVATIRLYKRAASAPSIDWSNNLTYDFETNHLTSIPTGWSENVPDGNDDLYATAATANSTTSTDTIAPNEWVVPVRITKNGLSWSTAAVFLYARADASTDLTKPTQTLDYSFPTGKLSRNGQTAPGFLGQWSQEIPATNGKPCFVIQATAASDDGQTDTIAPSDWSDISMFVADGEDGAPGANGRNTVVLYLYKRSSSAPSINWTKTLTYTFATNTLSELPTGWSRDIPSGTDPLYVTAATATSTEETDTIGYTEWTTPVMMARNGQNGENGTPGLNSATVFLYARAESASSLTKPTTALTYTFASGTLANIPQPWSQQIPTSDGNPCFVIQATAVNTAGTDSIAANEWSAIALFLTDGEDGRSILSITEYYARSKSSTTAPTAWTTTVPTLTSSYRYLWNYELITYSTMSPEDPTRNETQETAKRVIGVYGNTGTAGKGISSITEYYAINNSTTAPADSEFSTTVQTPTQENPFLWNYEVIAYTSGDPTTTDKHIVGRYGADGVDGQNGRSTVILYLYKRSSSAPSINWTTTLTYTFATNTLSPIPSGWSRSIPSGTDPLYVTAATASSTEATDTIDYGEWSAPVIMAQNGEAAAAGMNTATVFLYARATSASALTKPTGTLTYTFSTGVLTPASSFSGWSQEIPASNGKPCFVIQATAISTDTTDSIAASEWSDITLFVSDGTNGRAGMNSATVFLYARAASASDLTKPTGDLTYTFLSGALAPTTRYAGWSLTIPDSDSAGNPCFMIQATAVNSGSTDNISASEWSDIKKLVVDGEDGRSISSITEYYQRSTSNTTVPTSWQTTVPTLTSSYKYLWNYEVITYSDESTSETTKRVIGVYGNTGKGISSITNHYLATASGSGVTTSTSGWTDTVQSMTATNKYLWNYETIAYTSGNPTNTTPTIIGVYGDSGRGISSVQEQYYLSTSESQVVGGTWQTTQPAWSKNHYIWTRSQITWSDNSVSFTNAICANAINGANEAVENLDDSLTQDEVFKRLTNGFNTEGVFLENGRLFVNSTGIATGFIHDKATVAGNDVAFYNEQSSSASRDYVTNDYISFETYACRATTNIYKYEWINWSTQYTTNVTRLGKVYYESSNIATRDYVVGDYITFGGNLYKATNPIYTGDTMASSGFKNLDLLGTCYISSGYYADRNYATNDYIYFGGNLYRATRAISSGTLIYRGANAVQLNLGDLYNNYWNLNTGKFVTRQGQIADFVIGKFTTSTGNQHSALAYLADHSNDTWRWDRPYRAVNTPNQGVALCGVEGDESTGYTFMSQGRMYVSGMTNFAGRIRFNSGMTYYEIGMSPSSTTSGWTVAASINPFIGNTGTKGLNVNGAFAVSGSKSRKVETESYGERLLYSYETPTPMFGDIGEGTIGEDGICYIWFDPIFSQTIEDCQYQVFLQKYGEGECYVAERKIDRFVVKGTVGLSFGWEVKAKQLGYQMARLSLYQTIGEAPENQNNFSAINNDYLQNLREGRVTQ